MQQPAVPMRESVRDGAGMIQSAALLPSYGVAPIPSISAIACNRLQSLAIAGASFFR